MAKFEIRSGSALKASAESGVLLPHPVWVVVERSRGRVVDSRRFFDNGEAIEYVQRALNMDRDFAMEGR